MKNRHYKKHKLCNKISDDVMKNGILIGCHHGMKMSELKFMCKSFQIFLKKII